MKQITWGSLVGGLGLLLLLGMFALLVSRRYTSVIPVPATPVVNATVSTGETVSTAQTVMDATKRPVSVITATASLTTSNAIPTQWQKFSSRTAGYALFYPQNSMIFPLKLLPSTIEHTQITLPSSSDRLEIIIDIRVYDNSLGNSIDSFLSGLYAQIYGEAITDAKLQELMSLPLDIADKTGYEMDLLMGSTEIQIVIPHKNNFYLFILGHEFGPVNSSAEDVESFKRIVNTINFQ